MTNDRSTGEPEEIVQPDAGGAEENEIDQILADSFPASDAPPWTLGVTPALPEKRRERQRSRR